MAILWIRACWECDGCGKQFTVDIDSAYKPPSDWSTTDIALDAVRGGFLVAPNGHRVTLTSPSVQDGLVLCPDCTGIADEIGPEDHQATADEIREALGCT